MSLLPYLRSGAHLLRCLVKFWASNRPFNAPMAGIFLHWLACVVIIFVLPPGDAYSFVINMLTYPGAVFNAAISFGIIYLSLWPRDGWPSVSILEQLTAAFFGATNVFLVVFPFVPPPADRQPYTRLPYWSHAVAAWVIFSIGFLYWLVWAHLLPRIGGYTLVRSEVVSRDGLTTRRKFKRVPLVE
ncbi:hypothetical protein AX14_005096 [Amanita brunnescens Koide BX004]|nr:hypothetical protein AX14_005096 [Amanita brunnescens Koide BX004]